MCGRRRLIGRRRSCRLASPVANSILGDRSRRPLSVDGVESCVVDRGELCRICRDSRGDRRLAAADDVSDMAEAAKLANENCWPTRTTRKPQRFGDARSGSAIRRGVGMARGGWLGIGLPKNGNIHPYTYQVGWPFSTDFRSKCGGVVGVCGRRGNVWAPGLKNCYTECPRFEEPGANVGAGGGWAECCIRRRAGAVTG